MKYISYVLIPCVIMSTVLFTSCEQDGDGSHIEAPDGPPVISYIRMADPASSDSLIVSATLGTGIVIVGSNLGGTRSVLFNDKAAPVTPTWVTNRTIFVSVPSNAPAEVTNKIYLIDAKGNTLEYPFEVAIPVPDVLSVRNEWPQAGEDLIINGDFFFEPLTVTYSGGVVGEVKSVTQTQVVVSVPDGATEGPITVGTNFGETVSTFHIWDTRNVILDFDNTWGNGWRKGLRENADGPIDGNYLVVRGNIGANQRVEGPDGEGLNASPLMMEYWGHNDANRPEGNFYPLYPNSYREYVLKFEAKVNKWYGGYLNLVLSPWSQNNNADMWVDPFVNTRAIWAPWLAENEEFTTDGQWITVVIPISEFKYNMGVQGGAVVYPEDQKFVESAAGSLSTWLLGSPQNTGNAVEFYIDNMRIVKP